MKNKTWLASLLILITAAALAVTVWALFFRNQDSVLPPDYAPVEEEPNAQPIEDDSDEKLQAQEGGGAVSLTYSTEVAIDLSQKNANLLFANPGKSLQEMVVQIVIEDTVIVQSGTLKPGRQVTTLNLMEGAEKQIQTGGYNGKFVVFYYDPDSGEKAVVNTEIPITITVQE